MTADAENHAAKRAIPDSRLERPLLILTILFVMLAEVLIWAPSMARFRKVALENHMETAHLAALPCECRKIGRFPGSWSGNCFPRRSPGHPVEGR